MLGGSNGRMRKGGVHPPRPAVIDLLRACGLTIAITGEGSVGGEPVGDLDAGPATALRPLAVSGDMAAEVIDELPVLAGLAAQLPGASRMTAAAELRAKGAGRRPAVA